MSPTVELLCAATIPIAFAAYTIVTNEQKSKTAEQRRQFDLRQAEELKQQKLYNKFINDTYTLHRDGELDEQAKPWAFANTRYRSAHLQWDSLRKTDVLHFLKDRELIGRNKCHTGCEVKLLEDIIYLSELSFDNIHLRSDTGSLVQLNLKCVRFQQVSLTNATFSYVNLNGVSFDQSRLNGGKFQDSSLVCGTFHSTELRGTDFDNSDLQGAVFINVDLTKAKLTEKQTNEATFYNTTMPNGTLISQSTTTKGPLTTMYVTATPPSLPPTSNSCFCDCRGRTRGVRGSKNSASTLVTAESSSLTEAFTITDEISLAAPDHYTTSASTPLTADCPNGYTLIDFESFTHGVQIPAGYYNLQWTNAVILSVDPADKSGYPAALTSGRHVAYNGGGNPMIISAGSSAIFSIKSFVAAAARRNNLSVTMEGYLSGKIVHSKKVILQTTLAAVITLDWNGIDKIRFTTSGGTVAFTADGKIIAMDNLCSAVT
ncbi:unnamed protein product [Didymodactylos carnosus]|uniref:Uncharacterized protein n=1 Tax=Didymodactylos carnosus TaxID=1234261 RepID=A0A814ZPG3_9BILA|nr:unnamed protein product [Didymodactylos carnosus]CAF4009309.1 unnamed protein product [Didymodactylos carnosus]